MTPPIPTYNHLSYAAASVMVLYANSLSASKIVGGVSLRSNILYYNVFESLP